MPFILGLLILSLTLPAYGGIKNIPVYPAGISVEWKAVPPVYEEEEEDDKKAKAKKKRLSWRERRRLKKAKKETPPPPPPAPVAVNTTRLVRVISAVDLKPEETLALVFYDEKKAVLKKNILLVESSVKPSPANIFFMDRAASRSFKGMRDTYFFPPKAAYMNIALVDKKGAVISVPPHSAYDEGDLLSIQEFEKLSPTRRMMLQFEMSGTSQKSTLRMAIFRFR